MKTTLVLDDDVYEAAVKLSRSSGQDLGKVISELSRCGLQPRPELTRKGRRRFPTFEVPPDAPIIPASRVQKVVDDEGCF